MQCRHSHVELQQTSKFCPDCGLMIDIDTTGKGQIGLLNTYIPKELAKKMLSAGGMLESERRLVTVLFADITGFTAMSEKLDPEQVTTILNECFRGLVDIVYRYEGFVDKFIGDEIMAIFGAPVAHENDPERAVRCSLEMISFLSRFNTFPPIPLPQPLGIHIGLNTGPVVSGNIGSDLRMNYSVIGDTVNLAARLVGQAKSGQIFTSETTLNAIHNIVKVGNSEMMTLKGKAEQVKVYSIIGIDEAAVPGERKLKNTVFVGRLDEIGAFNETIANISKNKESRLFIRGEAGVGKSRLKLEFKNAATRAGITMYEGKCSSFETNTPYYLWNSLLKSILGIEREAPESVTRSRLHDFLQILGLQRYEPYLASLLSLRYEQILMEEDDRRKTMIFESVVELFKSLSTRKKIYIVFEDLHWVDRFSNTLLHFVFQEQQLAPMIFAFIFRGEYLDSEKLRRQGGQLLDLNLLTKEEATKLIYARLNVSEIPVLLIELIYKRSEGNPFFIEEIIRMMMEKKWIEIGHEKLKINEANISDVIPDTVQGIIMARIDRLEERIKDVLLQASVIGREFSRPVLEKVVHRLPDLVSSLDKLNTLELILPKEEAKELEYLFKHYLIQEVAYNRLLVKRRKELHLKIAIAIESLYSDQLRDFYELLSFHYERAEQWDKAAEYLARSGRKVQEIYSKEESESFEVRKQEAMEKLFESEGADRLGLSLLGSIVMIFAIPLALMGVILPATFMFMLHDLPTEFHLLVFGPGLVGKINLGLYIAYVWSVYPWVGLTFFFWGILPFFRPKPKLYDITDDAIRIGFKNGRMMNFPFSELNQILFVDSNIKKKRKWWQRFFDPFYMHPEATEIPFTKAFLKIIRLHLPVYAFGFESRKGVVRIKRKKGWNVLRLLFPWLNLPSKVQYISLAANAPQEFAEQANIAYEKWKLRTSIYNNM